eukprot:scaffold445861_cov20-Prasinocladus_malaysianus.AAC.1
MKGGLLEGSVTLDELIEQADGFAERFVCTLRRNQLKELPLCLDGSKIGNHCRAIEPESNLKEVMLRSVKAYNIRTAS